MGSPVTPRLNEIISSRFHLANTRVQIAGISPCRDPLTRTCWPLAHCGNAPNTITRSTHFPSVHFLALALHRVARPNDVSSMCNSINLNTTTAPGKRRTPLDTHAHAAINYIRTHTHTHVYLRRINRRYSHRINSNSFRVIVRATLPNRVPGLNPLHNVVTFILQSYMQYNNTLVDDTPPPPCVRAYIHSLNHHIVVFVIAVAAV